MKTKTIKTNEPDKETPRPKSRLKAALGKYKGIIRDKEGCWDEDLKQTIPA